jgi:hypothetical protein
MLLMLLLLALLLGVGVVSRVLVFIGRLVYFGKNENAYKWA